jgi:hypothetical protein
MEAIDVEKAMPPIGFFHLTLNGRSSSASYHLPHLRRDDTGGAPE